MKLNRQCAPVLVGLSLVLVQGCSRPPAPKAEQFVGKWRSSRLASLPLTLASNGEWEIKGDGGAALQYGVWRIEGQRVIWTIRIGLSFGRLMGPAPSSAGSIKGVCDDPL
jgi:hypothetical protein